MCAIEVPVGYRPRKAFVTFEKPFVTFQAPEILWCERRDSNPDLVKDRNLNPGILDENAGQLIWVRILSGKRKLIGFGSLAVVALSGSIAGG